MMTQLTHITRRLRATPFREGRFASPSVRAAILLGSLGVVPANGASQLALNVTNGSTFVRVGDTITVTLDVTSLAVPINGIQAFVHYDTNVLRLVDVVGNDNVGTGWTAITEDQGGGDFLQLLVMLGAETAIDHTAATLTFEAMAVGSTSVAFLADDPPLRAKLTAALDASPILPVTLESETIVVDVATIPTVSQWGLATMALLLITMGSLVLRKSESEYACNRIRVVKRGGSSQSGDFGNLPV